MELTYPVKGVIIDAPNTLYYDFGHPALKDNPDLKGQPIPGAKEVLDHLWHHGIPMALTMHQAGPFYGKIQPALIKRVKDWKRNSYPDAEQLVGEILGALSRLGIAGVVGYPLFVSVYHSWVEHSSMLNIADANRDILPELGCTLAEAAELVEKDMRIAFARAGIKAFVSANRRWRKPDPEMPLAAKRQIEQVEGKALFSNQILFVGDLYEPKVSWGRAIDEKAAKAAGMQFWPGDRLQELPTLIPEPVTSSSSESDDWDPFLDSDDLP